MPDPRTATPRFAAGDGPAVQLFEGHGAVDLVVVGATGLQRCRLDLWASAELFERLAGCFSRLLVEDLVGGPIPFDTKSIERRISEVQSGLASLARAERGADRAEVFAWWHHSLTEATKMVRALAAGLSVPPPNPGPPGDAQLDLFGPGAQA